MKISLLFFGALIIILTGCQNETETSIDVEQTNYIELPANKYNAVEINNQISSIQKASVAIIDTVFKADTLSVSKKLEDAIFELDVSIQRLKSLSSEHQMVDYFASSVIDLLQFYRNQFTTEFNELLPTLKKSNLTSKDRQILESYDMKFVGDEAALFEEIVVRQDSFANFFKIGLSN